MRLRKKINLYTAVLFIFLLLLMNVSIYFVFSNLMMVNEMNRAKAETGKIAFDVSENVNNISPNDLLRAYLPIDGMIGIVIEGQRKGTAVTSNSEKQLSNRNSSFYPGEKSEIITYQQKKYVFVSNPIVWGDGSVVNLQITKSMSATEEMLAVLRIVLIAVTIIAMIPVLISSTILSNFIARPIRSMIDTMKEIQTSGQFKRLSLEEKSKDELVEMGKTFNHMIDLLQANFEKQEQFVSNASHELKTPLTVIESYASLLKRKGLERPDLFDESIEAIHSEAIRMREMTEQMLLLAKHQEKWNIEKENVNLTDIMTELAKVYKNAYNRTVEIYSGDAIEAVTDVQKLKQLLFIFLDNARKYSDELISVYIGQTSNEAYIRIEDRGDGIPKAELPKVFDRFYRVDKARNRKQGGSGLGLSVAKEIADAIDVRIEMDSLEGRGTIVTLLFN
ncbi:ATP-binding protein [Peribacillus castrilensis]|uniref:histidine kinase n=1 Tax=Peribacillus simplex TaxID=1478 RepID=A0AAN2PMK4_9BACI|nr:MULTISPECIES: HAMP domain-containing sensor histidine kinase [Bacillaceae]MCF7624295.1 HAMP domain-containing histidine kinase [Peribacillus frigoritolerans]MCP1154856.1 HAMP domain-containing histidine kinase [Peribacillus frigoritolerans]MCT1388265.1 HAMP domain-containing histidine kinase [Peribacillus frigoritolerans]MEA3575960.1 HAMP domain-containing sensor histidine kinase [Peribacillus frigoritolerans]PRA90073.1 sensor histidine kinase [Peribacillus simplex]